MNTEKLTLKSGHCLYLDGIGDAVDFGSHNGLHALSFSIKLPSANGTIIQLTPELVLSVSDTGVLSLPENHQIFVQNIENGVLQLNQWQRIFILFDNPMDGNVIRTAGSLACCISDLCLWDTLPSNNKIGEDLNDNKLRGNPSERFLINEAFGSFLYGKNSIAILNEGSGNGNWLANEADIYQYGISERSELPVFNGNAELYANIDDIEISGAFTLSAWAMYHGGDRSRVIFGGNSTYLLGLYSDSQIRNQIAAGGPLNFSNLDLVPGKWHHLVLSRDALANNKTTKLYVDGQLVGEKTENADFTLVISELFRGGFGTVMQGTTDHMAIFDTELDAGQIEQLYTDKTVNTHPDYDDCIAYWVFDGQKYQEKISGNHAALSVATDRLKFPAIAGQDVLQQLPPIYTRDANVFFGTQGAFEMEINKACRRLQCWICPHETDNQIILEINGGIDIEINNATIEHTFDQPIQYMINNLEDGPITTGEWQLLTISWENPILISTLKSNTSQIQFGQFELSFFGHDAAYTTKYWNENKNSYE